MENSIGGSHWRIPLEWENPRKETFKWEFPGFSLDFPLKGPNSFPGPERV
jgi:hypothetical protein